MLYLSDAIRGEYVQNEFNVIEAPCGCGKTEYAVNKLLYEILGSKPQFNRVLYLIDTCAGRHSIVAKHPDKARCYDNIIDNGGRRFDGFDANRIVVITYAKLGVEVRRNPDFLNQFDLIIADEFHNIHWPIPYERGIIKTNYPYLTSSEVDALLKERCNNYHAMCPYCGCAIESKATVIDESNKGLNIISFLLPIVGAILYLVYHEKEPKKAAALGKWALYGLGFTVICYVLLTACGTAALYSLY